MLIPSLLALPFEYEALKREMDHEWHILGREKVSALLLQETSPSQLRNRYASGF
jgi:hypothetical protein